MMELCASDGLHVGQKRLECGGSFSGPVEQQQHAS